MDNSNSCLITFMLRRYNLFIGHILTLKCTPIYIRYSKVLFNSTFMRYLEFVAIVQLLSCVWFFATPWTAAHQASLSITNTLSFLKLISIELVIPCNHLVLLALLLLPSIFPSIRVFSNEWALCIIYTSGQSTRASASASVLPVNIQDWFPLGLTSWISL